MLLCLDRLTARFPRLSLRKALAIFSVSLSLFLTPAAMLPARAGQWLFTISGTPDSTTSPASTPPVWNPPSASPGPASVGYSISAGSGGGPNQVITASDSLKCPLHVSVTWLPNGSLASDPQPAVLRLSESGTATWTASGSDGSIPNTTGSGSASFSGLPATTMQYSAKDISSGWDRPFTGKAMTSRTNPPNGSGGVGVTTGFTYNVSAAPISATLTVDQNLQLIKPAATAYFSATISNASGFTIDSVKISVDGTPTTATVNPNNPNNYFINWPQAGGNPSEHTVTATAQIHDSVGALSLDSTNPPNRSYQPSGMGQAADDMIADVVLQSIKFNSNIALSQDASTPVPSPEITLVGASPRANPAAYIQGKNVNFTMLLGSSTGAVLTGSAPMGYALKMQATPNTTDPSTNKADPVLTLYDNTTTTPFTPVPCTASTTIAAKTALNSWVSSYATSFPVLTFYVEFTKLPTSSWSALSSYNSSVGNTLYAVVATPTAPMASPWVSVLNYACNWAKRTTSATSATTALTTGLYNAGHYNQGHPTGFTGPFVDGQEDFYPAKFINAGLTGQCNDFADFLCCVSNSIGAVSLQPQRSASVKDYNNGSSFTTKPITASGTPATTPPSPGAPVTWAYHQWTTSNVYDGCLLFGGTVAPNNLSLQSYHDSLVSTTLHTNPIFDWDPQSAMTLNLK